MIFRQLFDLSSSTYTYFLASGQGGQALFIDPVKAHIAEYRSLIDAFGVQLTYAIDTHTHADHITALGELRRETACITIMGEFSQAECVSQTIGDGDILTIDDIHLRALHTPGHTNESFSFVLNPERPTAVFTGDTLLIGGSGRTDFQGGDPGESWDSIVGKLFDLPDETIVYPAHDYHGRTSSTIGEEKQFNPRLANKTKAEYIAIMESLDLPYPKLMDIAVPANLTCGEIGK